MFGLCMLHEKEKVGSKNDRNTRLKRSCTSLVSGISRISRPHTSSDPPHPSLPNALPTCTSTFHALTSVHVPHNDRSLNRHQHSQHATTHAQPKLSISSCTSDSQPHNNLDKEYHQEPDGRCGPADRVVITPHLLVSIVVVLHTCEEVVA